MTPEEAVKHIATLTRDIDASTPEKHVRSIVQNVQELARKVGEARLGDKAKGDLACSQVALGGPMRSGKLAT